MIKNRQINTKVNNSFEDKVILEAVKDASFNGKTIEAGQIVEATRAEAKKVLTQFKGLFKIKLTS